MDGQAMWHDLGPAGALAEGRPTVVRAGAKHILLVRVGDAVHATEPLCPHKFTSLEDATVEDGCLRCPMHDAAFRLDSGQPHEAWAGVLGTFPCKVQDGRVFVDL